MEIKSKNFNTMSVLIIGNPIDGFRYFGPYFDGSEALAAAQENKLDSYWIAQLELPSMLGGS